MSRLKPQLPSSKGFTIIELMIATLVFSVILLIVTAGIISLTDQYYKGITSSKTQGAARQIMDTIANDIQLAPGGTMGVVPPANSAVSGVQYFCTGTHVYSYMIGKELVDSSPNAALSQSLHALVQSPQSGSCGDPGAFPPAGSGNREMLTPSMRITKLNITQVSPGSAHPLWQITVRVTSGDDDLFTNNPPNATSVCKGGSGSQFCAVSELTTTVEERL